MPYFERTDRDGAVLYFEERGRGFPLFLIAPGGMRSTIEQWAKAAIDPRAEFASEFRVIAMDQRNTGRSTAPIDAQNDWYTHTEDQIALLDHLGVERCAIMGGCAGCAYCLALINRIPERVTAAVLMRPIGRTILSPEKPRDRRQPASSDDNQDGFFAVFDEWAADMLKERRPGATPDNLASYRRNMYGGDFVFTVTREFVRGCQTPLLILPGDDTFHPTATAFELAELAPNAEILPQWMGPERIGATIDRVRGFLREHSQTAPTRT